MVKSFSFNSFASSELNSSKLFIISICSMLGVGIFLKSKTLMELSSNSFWPILVLFCISAGLIISMCWAFTSLVDKKTSSSSGFMEWVEEYCGSNFKSWALEFTTKLLHPLGMLTTSIYLIKWINGQHFLWVWEASICAIVISFLVISLNVFSFKGAVMLQKCLSFSMFLAMLYTLGFGIHSYFAGEGKEKQEMTAQLTGLNSLGGWTILLSGLPSIFFMYDGFYSVLALKEKTNKKTSFSKMVSLSFMAITLIYFLVMSITLLGEKQAGDFLKFKKLMEDKNFKDVLMILMFLTFLSSLNVACMCGLNQVIQLHYKYNFKDLNSMSDSFFSVGNWKYSLELKLSVWFHLLSQMAGVALMMATISQLMYWAKGENGLLWEINDMLAELNSLVIFGILGMVLWNSSKGLKANYLTSISILMAIIYFLLNNVVGLFYGNGKLIISMFKLLMFGAMLLYPAFSLLKAKMSKSFSVSDLEPKSFNKLNQEYSLIKLAVS